MRPAEGWGDVAVRAELASAYAERTRAGGFVLIDENPIDERVWPHGSCGIHKLVLGSLMTAALAVGGAHV